MKGACSSRRNKMNDMANTRTRWPKWLVWLGLVLVGGAGCALFVDHPPYPLTFNIEWDEEVQVADKQVIWVHRTEIYQRWSTLSRWDARKVAEELSFTPSTSIGQVHYRIDLGAFGGIERTGPDWVVTYGGTNPNYLHMGSCLMGGHGTCVFVIKADGKIYKPGNANEIIDNFHPLFRCRTAIEDCYRRLDGAKLTLSVKDEYYKANPALTDFEPRHTGKPFPPSELSP